MLDSPITTMKRFSALCLAALALVLPTSAQGKCSSLAVTALADDVRPYQTVTIDVAASLPGAPVYLAVGPTPGKTKIDLRNLGVFVLELDLPFRTLLLGTADGDGNLSRSVTVKSPLGLTLHAQAVGLQLRRNPAGRPTADICVSNAVSFDL